MNSVEIKAADSYNDDQVAAKQQALDNDARLVEMDAMAEEELVLAISGVISNKEWQE